VAARVVCISRSLGAFGEEVGRLVAERLGFRYVDEEIVSAAASREKLDPELVADAERRRSLVERLLNALAAGGAEAYVGQLPDDVTGQTEHYRALIRDTIEEAAAQGEVVIVAHAGSFALHGQERLLRVLVTASPETRARRLAQTRVLGEAEASKAVKTSDAARADYLRRFYEVEAELPTHYDLVVNTDGLTAEEAAAVVTEAAGTR
jgi:Cytidylate kinase-like family